MKIGERIIYVGECEELTGKEGEIISARYGYVGVRFDEPVPDGSDLHGKVEAGYGRVLQCTDCMKVGKYKIGEEIRIIKPNRYGEKGIIVRFTEKDNIDLYEVAKFENVEITYMLREESIIREADFSPAPFQEGDIVTWNPEHRELIYQHYLNSLKEEDTFLVEKIYHGENDFIVISDHYHLPADILMLANTNKPKSELLKLSDIAHNFPFVTLKKITPLFRGAILGGSAIMNSITILSNMLYSVPQYEKKNYDTLIPFVKTNPVFCHSLQNIIWHAPVNYVLKHEIIEFSYLRSYVAEETGVVMSELTCSEEDYWVCSTNGTMFVLIDPLDEQFTMNAILSAYNYYLTSVIGFIEEENIIYNLIVAKEYEKACEVYNNHCVNFPLYIKKIEKENTLKKYADYLSKDILKIEKARTDEILVTIHAYEIELRNLYSEVKKKRIHMLGLQNGMCQEEIAALNDFFIGMGDRLVDILVNSEMYIFQVIQPWLFFDEDTYELANFRKGYGEKYSKEVFELLDDIVAGKIQFLFEESFSIDKEGAIRYIDKKVSRGIPNPHHACFNCWGDNKSFIAKSYMSGQYVAAYSQVLSAIAGINFADGMVMERFIECLSSLSMGGKNHSYFNIPCIQDNETRELFTVYEYCEKIRKEKGE